jgi:hypothetical protein
MVAAIERRVVLFAVLLALGVLARENVLVLAPLLALNPPFTLRSFATASAAATPALGALFWVHAFPPVSADPGSASTLEWVQAHLTAVATNADDTALRALAAFPLSCGLLLAPIIAAPRAALRLVARQPGWTYLVVILSLIAIIGGRDNDRYLLTISPIVVVVAFAMMRALWRRPLVVAMLTGAHLVATRAFVPLADMPIFTAGWMPHDELVSAATASAVLCVIGALVCRIASGWSRFALVDRAPFTSLGRTLATEAARNVIRGQV